MPSGCGLLEAAEEPRTGLGSVDWQIPSVQPRPMASAADASQPLTVPQQDLSTDELGHLLCMCVFV